MKTSTLLEEACNAIANLVSEGKRILYVGTKKQAKGIIREEAVRTGQFYVTDRWLGGCLTNFTTIRKSVKRLTNIEKMETDGTFDKITKKEVLFLQREKDKLNKVSFEDMAAGKGTYPKEAQDGWLAFVQHYFLSAWLPNPGDKREYSL